MLIDEVLKNLQGIKSVAHIETKTPMLASDIYVCNLPDVETIQNDIPILYEGVVVGHIGKGQIVVYKNYDDPALKDRARRIIDAVEKGAAELSITDKAATISIQRHLSFGEMFREQLAKASAKYKDRKIAKMTLGEDGMVSFANTADRMLGGFPVKMDGTTIGVVVGRSVVGQYTRDYCHKEPKCQLMWGTSVKEVAAKLADLRVYFRTSEMLWL